MDGSPSAVVTQGLGLWGRINLLITSGFGMGQKVSTVDNDGAIYNLRYKRRIQEQEDEEIFSIISSFLELQE